MAAHSSILAWKISQTEEPGRWGRKESDMIECKHAHIHTYIRMKLEKVK